MKFLVCISKTPETTAKIAFTENNTEFDTSGVQFIMNPYDEWYALVRAVELKESLGGEVVAINVGPASNDIIIRKALAIGADRAIRINAEPESALGVAKLIADHAKDEQYDIVFTGKETIDFNGSEVAGMVAEYLDLPFISYASKLEMEGQTATINRDIEGGVEGIKVDTPFVISAAKGLAEQRIPNMRGIMMAKRKPLEVIEPGDIPAPVSVVKYELPEKKEGVKLVDPENMDELVRLLHEESKVI
ncbi:electron transfer flavoprotein subunit beta/FixA family protein [Portibacter marinus]|uniref:electron transfer flavoprotein subunit beta/FixA family protein n=1 Tax=Portibacter marinus TaxID=2898660 RepID=UPI001F485CEB|nr:electron transfer flavoprotein subunit beta/FixA family protein [Portibacter marinus]